MHCVYVFASASWCVRAVGSRALCFSSLDHVIIYAGVYTSVRERWYSFCPTLCTLLVFTVGVYIYQSTFAS